MLFSALASFVHWRRNWIYSRAILFAPFRKRSLERYTDLHLQQDQALAL
jgi:hypothetical protein